MIVRLLVLLATCLAAGALHAQTNPHPFTVISRVMEANARVVAIAIDFGRDLPLNWRLERAFKVTAELLPVRSYAGDVIGNSAAAKAPRTITRAYTRAQPEIGSPSQGRYVIVELDPDDFNASSWYSGFNPGIRQLIPYKENMVYDVALLHALNPVSAGPSPDKPGAAVAPIGADAAFRQAGTRLMTADSFMQAVHEMPGNSAIKFLAYNLHKPARLPAGAKVPLVVFLHGSGQSHDYKAFANAPAADVLSPLLANQGGVAWVELGREPAFVLVPQVPARDTRDATGEGGWRSADTQALLLTLVDKLIAENPAIDTRRLYLTGLSLGAMGSWKILTHPDPRISRKFAAAALIAGVPKDVFITAVPGENAVQKEARVRGELQAFDYRHVAVPLWLFHADTDPVVDRAGSRVPFARITGWASVDAAGQLAPRAGVLTTDNGLVRHYEAPNQASGTEVRYTEYQFKEGNRFLEMGMVTRHGHFTWEAAYKDRAMIDWMFRQVNKVAP